MFLKKIIFFEHLLEMVLLLALVEDDRKKVVGVIRRGKSSEFDSFTI